MHFALRRDIADLISAAALTPPADTGAWRALADYWALFAELLHHHHAVEDEHYWPALSIAVADRGTDADRGVIAAMEREHAEIGPAVAGCDSGFVDVLARPDDEGAGRIRARLAALGRILADHTAHEEREALPLVQRVVTPEEYARIERAIGRSYSLRMVCTMLPWAFHGLPAPAAAELLSRARVPERVLLRLTRRRFERRHAAAFGVVPAGHLDVSRTAPARPIRNSRRR
nr:hemerythrin domain-containing protein [Nocardia arizonensis]